MKNTTDKKMKVYVAMSGGVDSSVSAAILKMAGFDVYGVYMRQWSPKVLGAECLWKQDRQDAMKVCAKLGIPFLTWDFSKEYEKQVGKYMIDSYKKGITPNPDVMCNKVIKFGLFLDRALKEGADFIATGHYAQTSLADLAFSAPRASLLGTLVLEKAKSARSVNELSSSSLRASQRASVAIQLQMTRLLRQLLLPRNDENVKLLKATDKDKDQTYFLYDIPKKVLPKVIFPIGNLTKPEVRKLAKNFGLENAAKKDSQGICFIGQFNVKNFLKEYIKPKKGKIILISQKPGVCAEVGCLQKIIGEHDGAYYYTIGQRHGLDIKNGQGPYFVVKKDINKNIIYVGGEKDLLSKKTKIININWLSKPMSASGQKKSFPIIVDAQTRYRAPLAKAVLYKNGNLTFKKPERAVTPGQSVVFYVGNEILGGGTIK